MILPPSPHETTDNHSEHEGPVDRLMRLTATAGFLRSNDERSYAEVKVGRRRDVYSLKSAAFRDWLIDRYDRDCRQLPSDWAIRRVLDALEAIARFEGGTPSIFIRVGHDAGSNGNGNGNGTACYLDLADPSGHAVKIGLDGWSVVNNPGVLFRRPAGHLPLPMPSREGSIELLRPYVNVTDRDFTLLVVWMAAALRPVGPYPILALYGEQGAAKSTTARVVRLLITWRTRQTLPLPQRSRRVTTLTRFRIYTQKRRHASTPGRRAVRS